MKTNLAIVIGACWLATIPLPPLQGGTFQGLGDLPGGDFASWATGISADGRTVIGSSRWSESYPNSLQAFVWTPQEGMQGLGVLPHVLPRSSAHGVSSDGSVIVGDSDIEYGGYEAFFWTKETGMVRMGHWATTQRRFSDASGVSADGRIIVGSSSRDDPAVVRSEAFRWTAETGMVGLGFLGSDAVNGAADVSADGQVIVGTSMPTRTSALDNEAYRWTPEAGMVALGYLPNAKYPVSAAYAVSSDGSVVVGQSQSSDGQEMAFRWTAETGMVALGRLPGDMVSSASAVSADGSIVLGTSRTSSSYLDYRPFIWDAGHGMRNLQDVLTADYGLDLTGWTLKSVGGISDDGRVIVGSGINPQGNTEAFRAVIPEPSTLLSLFTFGVMAALLWGVRWQKTAPQHARLPSRNSE